MSAHAMPDPVRQFEHTHGHLTKLVVDLGEGLRRASASLPAESWREIAGLVGLLREELLAHFADEEEALFPFLRARVAHQSASVDRLEAAHDALCETLARLLALASESERDVVAMQQLGERFGRAYADHSVDEAALFEEIGRALGDGERAELARLVRGVRGPG